MTSGTFRSLDVSTIVVNRDIRHRKELTQVEELAASISMRGLIHPILVQRETLELVAGERRLAACKSLGWSHIPAQYEDEADPVNLRALELEENVRRVDLTWQDQCLAILDYHRLQVSQESDWTHQKTALALNMSPTDISRKIGVAEEIERGNAKVVEAPRYSTAVGLTERAKERATEHALELMKVQRAAPPESIVIGDFNEWATTYNGPKFNFIHCDFPFGIGADSFDQGSASLHGGYSDTSHDYERLCNSLRVNIDRLVGDTSHIMFWFSMGRYKWTLDFLSTFFTVDPFPLVWTKSDNSGILPDPERGPRRIYETAFYGSRGDRKIVRAKSNAIDLPSEKDIHMSIKPRDVLGYFFQMFVDGTTKMLDPTCGSGSALRAAEALGANYVFGLEKNPDYASSASKALDTFRRQRKVAP